MQSFFREWAAVESLATLLADAPAQFVDLYSPLNFMVTLHHSMMGKSDRFADEFDENARLLRQVAGQLIDAVLADKSASFADDDVMRQVQAWQGDSILRDLRSVYRQRKRPTRSAGIGSSYRTRALKPLRQKEFSGSGEGVQVELLPSNEE